jgi:hypothetical protein
MALQKIPGRAIQLASQANSDVMYFDGTDWVRLAKGEAGDVLTVNEDGNAPQWGRLCVFPGTQFGYVCGGFLGKWPDNVNGPNVEYGKQIQKISFTTDGNSTDIGDILSARRNQSGHSSTTHGFVVGGYLGQAPSSLNVIERFSFTTEGNSTDWADLTTALNTNSVPASSCTHGYSFGGQDGVSFNTKVIDQFPFASQTNATDWAECSVAQYNGAGCSSDLNGYALGSIQHSAPGIPSGTVLNNIDKYPFASQTNSTDIGDLVLVRFGGAGVSSETDGYMVGGVTVGTNPGNSAPLWDRTNIDKFSFATGTQNAVDHGDLPLETSAGAHDGTGMSAETHGYHAGGIYSWNSSNHQYPREQIEKFAYASNVTATDVGDLVQVGTNITPNFGMNGASGHQF